MSNYEKINWKNSPETEITAEALNHMDDGIKEAHDKINLLEKDYIIEQGTDGIWTYRKWNSGIAECWGYTEIQNLDCGAEYYSGFYYSKSTSVPFPNNLFSGRPCVAFDGGSANYINFVRDFGSTKENANFLVAGLISNIATVKLNIKAKGKWK
jgi:hypothetical protein